jgi:hypothetical protein
VPYLARADVAQVVQYEQRLPAGVTRLLVVSCGVVGVAEVGKRFGCQIPGISRSEKDYGLPVAVHRLVVVAELAVDVAQTVPGVACQGWISRLAVQVQCLLAVARAFPGIPEHSVVKPGVGAGSRLKKRVTGGLG